MFYKENSKLVFKERVPNLLRRFCILYAICFGLNSFEPKRMSNLLKEIMSIYNDVYIYVCVCLSLGCSGDVDMTDRPPRKTAPAALEAKQSIP